MSRRRVFLTATLSVRVQVSGLSAPELRTVLRSRTVRRLPFGNGIFGGKASTAIKSRPPGTAPGRLNFAMSSHSLAISNPAVNLWCLL